jgi:hypothetical protein
MPEKGPALAVRGKNDARFVATLAVLASLAAFFYYYRTGQILLYGDAVAHMHIARRVFDSKTPSILQLGTVWLPLPHLLILPFVIPMKLWQSGVGGSLYSMVSYVFATAGMCRLAQRLTGSRAAGWVAAAVFGANPNLLYLQATAMTEALYLALFIWATVFFVEFMEESRAGDDESYARGATAITRCGWLVAAMVLTRYDGWFVGPFFVLGALILLVRRRGRKFLAEKRAPLWRGVRNMMIIAAAAPAFWLGYNWCLSGHPLDFALGPYSAKAIEQRSTPPGAPPHPGTNDMRMSATFFRKSAELNLTDSGWQHPLFFGALIATLAAFFLSMRTLPAAFVWLPWPFYALSIAYGSVPIFMPVWWPYSYYNVRYGLQLLPAVALGCGLLVGALRLASWRRCVAAFAIVGVAGFAYVTAWRATPISLREAQLNARTRVALETEIAKMLHVLPPDATILMYTSTHVGALQQAGIPLSHTINESTHVKSEMPHGLWERALDDPERYADFVVAIAGDPVAGAVAQHPAGLQSLAIISVSGQPVATIYQVRRQTR